MRGIDLRWTRIAGVSSVVTTLLLAIVLAVGVTGNDGSARATLWSAAGVKIGDVHFTEKRGMVQVRARVDGLTAGFHGFHIHAIGACTPPFTSAGGHYDPAGQTHRNHAGDLPVLLVNADGSAETRFVTDRFSVAAVIGRAVIIHADADNYANIPTRYSTASGPGPDSATHATGDAGARVACGVIEASED